jgi:ApaG protein
MTQSRYDITIDVEKTYVEQKSDPDHDRYVFAYTITIENTGSAAAQLITRHWLITDASGHVQEVRGEGVIGQQPRLAPGESFRYTSAAMLETPIGTMQGSYQMIADDGIEFDAPVSPFSLSKPHALH